MSLRFFHIVFIALAALLAAWVGIYKLMPVHRTLQWAWSDLWFGLGCLAAAVALAAYGVWYAWKTRGQSLI